MKTNKTTSGCFLCEEGLPCTHNGHNPLEEIALIEIIAVILAIFGFILTYCRGAWS